MIHVWTAPARAIERSGGAGTAAARDIAVIPSNCATAKSKRRSVAGCCHLANLTGVVKGDVRVPNVTRNTGPVARSKMADLPRKGRQNDGRL